MKIVPAKQPPSNSDAAASAKVGRRGLVVGTGVAGAAAVAVHAGLSGGAAAPTVAARALSAEGEGYRLTPHVLRYYETTKA